MVTREFVLGNFYLYRKRASLIIDVSTYGVDEIFLRYDGDTRWAFNVSHLFGILDKLWLLPI